MALPQLKLLINLAKIDGEMADKEVRYITNIGLANGIPLTEITPLFNQYHATIIPNNLSDKERFDCIFNLVQLMKIDEKLYKEEIRYCAKVASNLGYDQTVLFDLMLNIRTVMEDHELVELKKLTEKYLLGKQL